ncbi:hypothetical protein Tco_0421830 [Tanacetum coccineum]
MVTDDMVEYVLEKYGKNWNFEDEITNAKYARDDVDLVDADDVDIFDALDLENRVIKLEEDFTRLLKAKKAKEAKEKEDA